MGHGDKIFDDQQQNDLFEDATGSDGGAETRIYCRLFKSDAPLAIASISFDYPH